ncbi:alpha/beta hydrolase [Dactylosporangium sp. AC04546]|uniref:alpha/beta fold hydrolase n=1 Tax=Dactylosporangium sp. AC04546 TaxID=2862460 RepID=UPI002E7BD085|nr:alpha/beta hydrolase [Dactylosporangium sp. AC04546]WVK83678.1 alpha/beta hydrolase [Dactylosporangium sp. AC04546]
MFDGFQHGRVDLWDVTLCFQHSGRGPAVLLLHGPDRPHTTWHRVAPLLANQFTVVCPDLADPSRGNHETALDCVALMKSLGHDEFSVAGYGPAAHLALHLALTHPTLVERLALVAAEPPATPSPPAPAAAPAAFFPATGAPPAAEPPAATAPSTLVAPAPATPAPAAAPPAYNVSTPAARTTPATLGGSRKRRFFRPVLVVWAAGGGQSDPVAGWRPWCEDVRSVGIDGGRHLAEDAPEELAAALGQFLDHGTSPVS